LDWRVTAGLMAAILVAYLPAVSGTFLWDDDAHVTRPELRTLGGLWRIWTDFGATQQYYPLLHTAFWLEHRVWGNAASGYHLVNILLHGLSAILLLRILRRLEIPGAALAAAVFALHPVHVESVAWITEQKNTLSLVFYLGAAYVYLRFDEERGRRDYFRASALFVLGLLTKTVVATLPGALLVIAWWRRGRLSWRRDVGPLTPWFAFGAAAGLGTAWIEQNQLGAEGADFGLTPLQRVLLAGRVIWFYLGKLLWPTNLAFIYPRWSIDASAWTAYVWPLAALLLLAALWARRRRSRAALAAALFFVGSLFPVLGFVNVYPFVFSFVADHFQYLPSLGVIVGLAAAAATRAAALDPRRRRWALAAAAVLLTGLAFLTFRQSQVYRDAPTLYQATLARNPDCYLCLNNLGTLAARGGEMEEAARFYRDAVRIKPDSPEAHNNLASALAESGKMAESVPHFEQAVRAAPNYVSARVNFGGVLFRMGRVEEAKAQFEAALRIMPDYAPARQNLAVIQRLEAQAPPPR
jgi:tetratricopeptide (TPR) repeat protein